MKRLFTTVALAVSVIATPAFAQSESANDVIVGTESLKNNWFVSGGVGVSMFVGEADRKGSLGSRLAPAVDISVGKWVTPYFGARLQYSGPQLKGNTLDANGLFAGSANGTTKGSPLYKEKWSYMNIHVDAMFNVLNFFKDYKEDRFYSLVPYAGVGWARTPKNNNDAITLDLGIYNSFRLNDKLDLFADLRATALAEDEFDTVAGGDCGVDGIMTLTIGATYRFGKQGFQRPVPQSEIDGYKAAIAANEADLAKAKKQLAAAKKQAANAKKQLAAEKAKAPVVEYAVPTAVVLFAIDSSEISNVGKVNLENMAESINKTNTDKQYAIVGYADNKTGRESYNDKLSQKRAEAVRDYLVNECGVDSAKLAVSYRGGVDNMFYDDETLSRSVIVE